MDVITARWKKMRKENISDQVEFLWVFLLSTYVQQNLN